MSQNLPNFPGNPGVSEAAMFSPARDTDGNLETAGAGGLSSDDASPKSESDFDPTQLEQPDAKGWKFWMIFPPLCIATMLMALESTVTSTSLPVIAEALGSGDNYVWFLNGYLLTS